MAFFESGECWRAGACMEEGNAFSNSPRSDGGHCYVLEGYGETFWLVV